jgi:hypothetical protein
MTLSPSLVIAYMAILGILAPVFAMDASETGDPAASSWPLHLSLAEQRNSPAAKGVAPQHNGVTRL